MTMFRQSQQQITCHGLRELDVDHLPPQATPQNAIEEVAISCSELATAFFPTQTVFFNPDGEPIEQAIHAARLRRTQQQSQAK